MEADDNPIVKLAGAALDFHLNWRDEIAFADGERFAYRKPKSVLGGLVVGGMNLTHTVREEREREREKERSRERQQRTIACGCDDGRTRRAPGDRDDSSDDSSNIDSCDSDTSPLF